MHFKMFPARANKVPLVDNWKEVATNDPRQLQAWQKQFGNQFYWAIPCGAANGIFVLDIDVKKNNGWESLKKLGYALPDTLAQTTRSGGAHYIFKAQPGVHYSNSVNFEPGLDTRGDGGYIVWYGTANNKAILDPPDWLLNLIRDRRRVEVCPPSKENLIRIAPEIATGILNSALENIKNAPAGESNETLNIESFKVGQLVASGSFSRDFAFAELFKAAKFRGKPDYEAKATINSGLDGGMKNPLTSPFPNTAPVAAFEIPEAPKLPERWTPRRLTRGDLLNKSKLKKPQLFKDWSAEDITITTADGGTGKTTLKLFESICLALGDRFLGFDCVQKGKTLFITGEDTEAKIAAMIGAIAENMGIKEDDPRFQIILDSIVIKKDADLCLIEKDRQQFLHPNQEAKRKLQEAVDDFKPKRIVFDPIASFWGSESMLNDMNKAVTKFMSWLVEYSGAEVEMINHMGKSSSQSKDMTQFAGRGGSGLPSNSRISRVLRPLPPEEFTEMTGKELVGDQSAILCQVNKFSDGSVLFNKPFIIIRDGYLFSREVLTPQKEKEVETRLSDTEKVFTFVKEEREQNRWPTKKVIIGHFARSGNPLPKTRVETAIHLLQYTGHMGEKLQLIDNPDQSIRDQAFTITDLDGREV